MNLAFSTNILKYGLLPLAQHMSLNQSNCDDNMNLHLVLCGPYGGSHPLPLRHLLQHHQFGSALKTQFAPELVSNTLVMSIWQEEMQTSKRR